MRTKTGTFTNPVDGQVYKTVKIGNQVWMAENLNVSKYRNGDPVQEVPDNDTWGEMSSGAWSYYNSDSQNEKIFGKLYNWHAVNDPRGLAPEGWHIPTDDEWQELEMYLGMNQAEANRKGWRGNNQGCMLKNTGTDNWKTPNECATNITGFTGLPGGYRDVSGEFFVIGYSGYWWSSTEHSKYFAWYRTLYYTSNKIHRTNGYEGDGFSIRCIRDS